MIQLLRFGAFVSLAFLPLLSGDLHAATKRCKTELSVESTRAAVDHSVPSGIIKHGEHWVDLILAQGGSGDPRYFQSFQALALDLVAQAKQGSVALVNEKIDGSPSIVLGFTKEGLPFVAYKGELGKPGDKQRLVTSVEDAQKFFSKSTDLTQLYSEAIRHFGAAMAKLSNTDFRDYLFQGDLLFYPGATRSVRTDEAVSISANEVIYEIKKGAPYFDRVTAAKVGVVIHTIGKRIVREDGEIAVSPVSVSERKKIEAFVDQISTADVFAIHPLRKSVAVGLESPITLEVENEVKLLLGKVEKNLSKISTSFIEQWSSQHERRFRIFLNSFLRPPEQGGLYLSASRHEAFQFNEFLANYEKWLAPRLMVREGTSKSLDPASYSKLYAEFLKAHRGELRALFEAYTDSIRIQYLLQPHIKEIFQSKLGGGEVEGVMLETQGTIVKLVDRLGFTLRNNANRNRGSTPVVADAPSFEGASEPFNKWRPGAAFVLMKGQPVHSGHIEMINRAMELNSGGEVYVIASNKAPNLAATQWKEFGVTNTKRDLEAGNYTYVFNAALRRQILEAGLKQGTKIYFLSPMEFWPYLKKAKQLGVAGKVKLVMGAKEVDESRYDSQLREFESVLEPLAIEMQNGGISATQVRAALREYVEGTKAQKAKSKKVLDHALIAISDKAAKKVILDEMAKQWQTVDQAVRKVLGK